VAVFREALKPAIRAIGRVEVQNGLRRGKSREEIRSAPAQTVSPLAPTSGIEALSPGCSVLIDPGWFERYSDEELRRLWVRLNEIKQREQFRPIAPVCLDAAQWFGCDHTSPFMLYTYRAKTDALAAVTHVNGTARIQIVQHLFEFQWAGFHKQNKEPLRIRHGAQSGWVCG
jgi:hypothetical protein